MISSSKVVLTNQIGTLLTLLISTKVVISVSSILQLMPTMQLKLLQILFTSLIKIISIKNPININRLWLMVKKVIQKKMDFLQLCAYWFTTLVTFTSLFMQLLESITSIILEIEEETVFLFQLRILLRIFMLSGTQFYTNSLVMKL